MGLAETLRYPPRPLARVFTRLLQRSVQRPWVPIGMQRAWLGVAAVAVRRPKGSSKTRGELGGVPSVRVECSPTADDRAVLYLHGGGYLVGSARTHGTFAAWIAGAADAPVHLLEYRLAPEHPYPAAVDDTLAAYRDLVRSGLEPRRIAIAGDSAGAALAVAAALRLRDAGEPMPGGLLLINGWLDATCSGPSLTANARRDVGLRRPWLVAAAEAYAGSEDLKHPEISPVEADLAGLPPIHLQVGTADLLLSDSDAFAERARRAGVEMSYRRFEGMWHDFQVGAGQSHDADEAISDMGAAIHGFWGEEAEPGLVSAQPSTRAE
jgi:epsilon-lactone hydrolase